MSGYMWRFRSTVRGFVVFGVLGACSAFAAADLKVITEMKMSMNGDFRPVQTSTVYFKDNWVRIDSNHSTTLIDSTTQKTITIDHTTKTYTVAKANDNEASQMLASMQPKLDITVSATDEHKAILGLQATKYTGDLTMQMTPPMAGAKPITIKGNIECWTTTDIQMSGATMATMSSQQNMWMDLFKFDSMDKVKSEMAKMKGYPLHTKMTMNVDSPEMPAGSVTVEIEYNATWLSQANLNLALFRIPADYKAAGGDWKPVKAG